MAKVKKASTPQEASALRGREVVSRNADFELTDEEIGVRARMYAELQAEIDNGLVLLKEMQRQRKADLKLKQTEADELRKVLRTGTEERLVECVREPDLAMAVWHIIRLDTGREIAAERMSEADISRVRQIDIEDFASLPVREPGDEATQA